MTPALISLAFISGFLTFLTPCGLAMLPVYISYIVSKERKPSKKTSLLQKILIGAKIGALSSAGLLTALVSLGALIIVVGTVIKLLIPAFTILASLLLLPLGLTLILKKPFHLPFVSKIISPKRPSKNIFTLGLIYGLSVVSCSLPVFLAVTIGALASAGVLGTILLFSIYLFSSLLSMVLFTIILTLTGSLIQNRLKKLFPLVQVFSGIVILTAGVYIIYYQIKINQALRLINF